jgi:predicted RNase H-like HicB family nuclease
MELSIKLNGLEDDMRYTVETEQESDGRWLAEIVEIPGVMKYGQSREEAIGQAEALALRVIAERLENGEHLVEPIEITFAAA